MKKYIYSVIGVLVVLSFTQCGKDLDQYVIDKEAQVQNLVKEDGKLRDEFSKQIILLRTSSINNIEAMQKRLFKKIDDKGNDIITELHTSVANKFNEIPKRAANAKNYIDAQMGKIKTDMQQHFTGLENKRQNYQNQLQMAINQNDNKLQQELNTRINALNTIEGLINETTNKINGLEASLVEIEKDAKRVGELEKNVTEQKTKFDQANNSIDEVLKIIREQITEEYLSKLKSEQLNQVREWIKDANAFANDGEIESWEAKLRDYLPELSNLESKAGEIERKLEDLKSGVLSDLQSAYSEIDNLVSLYERIDGMDINSLETQLQSSKDSFNNKIEEVSSSIQETKNEVEGIVDEFRDKNDDIYINFVGDVATVTDEFRALKADAEALL
ncbi:hypothetical protein [Capnocytophaga canimorsus]|uniref:hypothetical protein n=1 Tax=Capnocytophaga canimorsus TaxID=28188 RepID=UPI001EDD22B3|nr:hypothetical protein [Capnocytophaga canimorsus]GJQ04710.1 hypothetical protein CAPN009_11250 [Capnocytophaga canimorsus]